MPDFHYRDPESGNWVSTDATAWVRSVHHNIFNADTISENTFFSSNTNASTISYEGWFISDYIPVLAGKEYRCVAMNCIKWFDREKNYLATDGPGSASGSGIFTAPENAEYCRIQAKNTDLSATQVHEYIGVTWDYDTFLNISSYTPTDEKYGEMIRTEMLDVTHHWKDKNFCFIGDSFSALCAWQTIMIKSLDAVMHGNYAVSGGRWSDTAEPDCAYEQAQNMVAAGKMPDVIMCTLGINDTGDVLGDIVKSNSIDDFDLTTFTGGMQACINYLQNNYPNSVILVGWTPASGSCNLSDTDTMAPLIERMKDVCLLYGVEYIETRTCGITKYSDIYADMWESGTGGGHPITAGYERIGAYMSRLLNRM